MNNKKQYIGVDVSKETLDIEIGGRSLSFSNTISGFEELQQTLKRQWKKVIFACESTGGYERNFLNYVVSNSSQACRLNAKRVRHFAKGCGVLAKTDKIDAGVIKKFCEVTDPRLYEMPSAHTKLLHELTVRRQQLIDLRTAESNKLDLIDIDEIKSSLSKIIAVLNEEIELIENRINDLLEIDAELIEKVKKLEQIVGIGRITANTLVSFIPELGTLTRREVSALAGLAPYNCDSGKYKGKRKIDGGRKRVRACLYMAAKSAACHNPILKQFHDRLKEAGKPYKVIIVAIMRKLVVLANATLKNNEFSLA